MTERMAWYNEWKNSLREVLRMETDAQRDFLDDSKETEKLRVLKLFSILLLLLL